jgi:hypothetical protein
MQLHLDLTSPEVRIDGPDDVEYPEYVEIFVVSSKPIADRVYVFTDAGLRDMRLGYEHLDGQTDRVLIPSLRLADGLGTFRATVVDAVGNVGSAEHSLMAVTPIPYEARWEQLAAYEVEVGHQVLYESLAVTRGVLEGTVVQCPAFEASTASRTVFGVTSTMENV